MAETRSTCPYCGVGCGVVIAHEAGAITGVRGDPDHPANFGRLCTKGSTLHLTATPVLLQTARLHRPMARTQRGAPLAPIGWDTALDRVADRLAATITDHGPDAVGFYLSGQLLTEDYHVFNKLAKGLIGSNNVDTNSRLCMSSAVSGYKSSLGADAPPACYDDLALARTVFITGSNMAWAHPVLFRRLEDARAARPDMKLVVVDPRRTETAAVADLHLAIQPGTDVMLHHAMLHIMLAEGLHDAAWIAAHTNGFEALRERVRDLTPARAARICGVPETDIVQAARWFAGQSTDGGRFPTLSLYCQGLNQSSSGTDKNTTLINLHLTTGQIGQPGAGPLSLTGQPNAMGGREVGGLATLLSGHRDLGNPEHRAEVARLWGVTDVPARPGKAAVQMFEAAADGEIRALWIACTNPAQSLPDQAMVRRALERCEFVVLQEAYRHTATTPYADLVLPASSWGEKDGSVTNSERRISRVRPAIDAPGLARHDWLIARDVAQRLEARLPSRRTPESAGRSMFDFRTPESVWLEHREMTRGRDLDITGLDWAALDRAPAQWPCPQGQTTGTARLYTDGRFVTGDGRARFSAPAPRGPAESCDDDFPLALTSGRLRDQWHGMSRTGTLGRLLAHTPEPALQMHRRDLERRGLTGGDLVRVRTRRGELVLPVQASDELAEAQVHLAMHWGSEVLGGAGSAGVNTLTQPICCPSSGQPELKHSAAQVEAVDLPWRAVAAAWLPESDWVSTREALQALMARQTYASCVPFGREPQGRVGLLLRVAADQPLSADWLSQLQALLKLDAGTVLRYADRHAGQDRAMHLDKAGRLDAFLLSGDTRAASWMLDLLQQDGDAAALGRSLLAASPTSPSPLPARSPQICACLDVSLQRIQDTLGALPEHSADPADRLARLQGELKCGTQCGSCLPKLRTLVQDSLTAKVVVQVAVASAARTSSPRSISPMA
ncbi:nitrate reductase [Sphaerotilus mobilis]|uniref:Assimilatory nitrate reductase (NADH) alpha subunit apoprotein n=1 Tax=Sphaerotilus mobilis TaxID=47994 RepID=A0A4Q7LQW5_9BURK|nr:nitrate reductase [Sphaerotilus mobilis]RZS56633.1 assimilatory nitrate reductase (NADH) alpha subunit apoprotein [Sphaerotilus mobilis]